MQLIDQIKQIEKYICEHFEEWDLDALILFLLFQSQQFRLHVHFSILQF